MGMYKRVDLMTINGLLDIPVSQLESLVYIYKLTYTHTGHFYIGQTKSVKDRVYTHMSVMVNLMQRLPCQSQRFHDFLYPIMENVYNSIITKKPKIERFVRESLSVYIIALVADKEAAIVVENHYIEKHKHDELFLNFKG